MNAKRLKHRSTIAGIPCKRSKLARLISWRVQDRAPTKAKLVFLDLPEMADQVK